MSRSLRQNKERNQRVRQAREQLTIVHESILALHEALKSGDKDTQQLLALTTGLDALLRRQDRLQRVIEHARNPPQVRPQESANPAATAELAAELVRRGLLPSARAGLDLPPANGPEGG
jgi:hypothetical protein